MMFFMQTSKLAGFPLQINNRKWYLRLTREILTRMNKTKVKKNRENECPVELKYFKTGRPKNVYFNYLKQHDVR